MKRLSVIALAALVASCGAPRNTETSSKISSTKVMKHNSDASSAPDDVVVSGTQYIPILGRSESGVRPDLEGTWVLQSVPGSSIEKAPPANQNKNDLNLKEGEVKRDSSTVKNADGSTRTTTNITMMDDNRGNKITPPQNSNPNMHVPEAPKLQFYGSNQTFSGFTGCNKISGRYSLTGRNALSFQNAAASTKMACIGEYDENAFLNTLRKVNTYKTVGNELQLMNGSEVIMIFARK